MATSIKYGTRRNFKHCKLVIMIIQREIIEHSKKQEVPTSTIDKDWVLGHFLNAMFYFEPVKELFIFKGGTCLKKCYTENYRFSEDLDFTLADKNLLIDETLIRNFIKKANEISNIKFHIFSFEKQVFEDNDQGYEIILKFWGANHKINQKPLPVNRWLDKIKLDISFSETILGNHVQKKILHPYSDRELLSNTVNVYSFNEIIAEKIRALIQRNRPRDIYDNWYFANNTNNENIKMIKVLLLKKAEMKNIKISGIEQFVNNDKREKNKRAWLDSLKHQMSLQKIPDFDEAYKTVHTFIEDILNS